MVFDDGFLGVISVDMFPSSLIVFMYRAVSVVDDVDDIIAMVVKWLVLLEP